MAQSYVPKASGVLRGNRATGLYVLRLTLRSARRGRATRLGSPIAGTEDLRYPYEGNMKTMAFASVGTVVIVLHSNQAPTDAEWAEYVKEFKKFKDLTRVRSLVFTDGGAPNSAQRKEVNDLLDGRPGLTAVISASSMIRGVVTALQWFNPAIKSFSPDRVASAYEHLKLTPAERDSVGRQVQVLRKEFDPPLQCVAA